MQNKQPRRTKLRDFSVAHDRMTLTAAYDRCPKGWLMCRVSSHGYWADTMCPDVAKADTGALCRRCLKVLEVHPDIVVADRRGERRGSACLHFIWPCCVRATATFCERCLAEGRTLAIVTIRRHDWTVIRGQARVPFIPKDKAAMAVCDAAAELTMALLNWSAPMQNKQRCPCGGIFVSHMSGAKYICGNCKAAFGRLLDFVCIEEGQKGRGGPLVGQHVFAPHTQETHEAVRKMTGHVGQIMDEHKKLMRELDTMRQLLSNNRIDGLEAKLGLLRRDLDALTHKPKEE